MHLPHALRRLAAAATVPALVLIGVIGISPTAAADSISFTASIEIIKEDDIKVDMARIKQNGILGQLLRDSWLAFTEGLL